MRILITASFSLGWFALSATFVADAQSPAVQPARHLAPSSLPPMVAGEQAVQFHQQPTEVGDRLTQRVGMEIELQTTIKQSDQVAHDSTTSLRRRQERTIEVLEVVGGRARKARVSYPLSRQMAPDNTDPDAEVAQVIEGRDYLITRSGEQLLVTDTEGRMPTREEFALVLKSVESFGRPSPLAEYLLAQTIRIGDTLQVPLEIVSEMMSLDQLGDLQKFELHVDAVRIHDGRECAVFTATIAAAGKPESPLQVSAHGTVVIDLATTRTVEATLTGPLTMNTAEGPTQYSANGNILLAVRSFYGRTER